ncbi:MAG: class I SAM-dependent methyltransferase [Candidatus Wildermuthbacteria bacterium]|nr:class I SAM-dependent methyltransferase [Candidatus Wildermuthbacteria bacterium]
MSVLILNAAIFLADFGLFGFLLLFLILAADAVWRGHYLPTSNRARRNIAKIVSEHKSASKFYDLGCGHGGLALYIKSRFPSLCVRAIDNSLVRILFAKMTALFLLRRVQFIQKNIFDADISDADIVYAYLWYDLLPPLEKKLRKELKQGAIVITNTSHFPNWEPIKKIVTHTKITGIPDFETLFVYRKD